MKNIPLLVGTLLATVLLVVGVAVVFSEKQQESIIVDQAILLEGAKHSKGEEAAPVTIVEFSDFQCPACREAEPLVRTLIANNPEKIRLVYRHFPLSGIHPYAQLAAQASEVAAAEGKFWEFHDKLFDEQETWAALKTGDEVTEQFARYAEELGIDKVAFLEKIESDQIKLDVASDSSLAARLKLNATPTFFVNGRQLSSRQLPSAVESAIQASE